jgi:hypothetical protein
VVLSLHDNEPPHRPDAGCAGRPTGKGAQMNDIAAVALAIGFFAVSAAFVYFCDKVR